MHSLRWKCRKNKAKTEMHVLCSQSSQMERNANNANQEKALDKNTR